MTPTPPPRPKQRVLNLWDNVDQARRAWAITQACRLWSADIDSIHDREVETTADAILAYVLEQP